MKLTIEHLAPYLPYGLEVKNTIGKKTELCISDISYHLVKQSKPLLIPLEVFQDSIIETFENHRYNVHYNEEILELFSEENVGIYDSITELDYRKLPYECIQYMAKHHYDFQGLIENNLAIDKTKI